jgi:hypothetical protein
MPRDPAIIELLTRAYYELGQTDSALSVAAAGADSARSSATAADAYAFMLAETGAAAWRRHLLEAKRDWLSGELVAAAVRLDSASAGLPPGPVAADACADVRRTLPVVEALDPRLAERLSARVSAGGAGCSEDMPN